ncbi:heat shock protein [Erysiphe necator]|uniref:Putative heat shock protein 30 n=1 Tax=Uncinula necator TaxID=52586 RepID=A0A0B1PBU1_UNCNE|nr:heat shock protein [Erysiphe necator]KHJ34416.1 putative heat shock protein 30 [Erysiphe necator]
MSLFPRSFFSNDQFSFPPIFRLLDEFDHYSRTSDRGLGSFKSFTPKFDIKEHKDSYELQGELPGIDQKDIDIEFTEATTLTIKGRTEHSYSSSAPPRGFIEGEVKNGEEPSKTVIKSEEGKSSQAVEKYWVRERSVGEFSRSFGFPTAIDQDNVKASMKNGILSIIVPKAQKQSSRKITIG